MIVLLLAALLALSPHQEAEDLFARARRLNPTLADYTAHAELELDATMGFVHDRRSLTGTYYYKREGRHKLDLPDAPSYLKGHTNAFGFSLPRLERYDVTALQPHLTLVPRTPQGSIQRLEIDLDPRLHTVREYDTYYSNGQLLVSVAYTVAQGYRVADTVTARFSFPDMHLVATVKARYSDFKFNQGLSDGLF